MYNLDVSGHIVFSGEFLETERTRVNFDIALVGGDIVATEVANVCIDARAYFTAICMFALFGTVITHRALALTLNDGVARGIQFGFGRW